MTYCSSHYGELCRTAAVITERNYGILVTNQLMMFLLRVVRDWGECAAFLWIRRVIFYHRCVSPYRFFYDLCRRDCNLINSCLISDSFLVRCIAERGVYFGRMSSPLRRNAQVCCQRFNFRLSYLSQLSSMFIISKVLASLSDDRKITAGLLSELCFLRDGSFWPPTSFLTTDEVNRLISCRM